MSKALRENKKISTFLIILMCVLMCFTSSKITATNEVTTPFRNPRFATERTLTSGVFFNVTDLSINLEPEGTLQKIIENDVLLWDVNQQFEIESGKIFQLSATWGATDTSGWEAGDFLIFDLPMSNITQYANGSGSLNSGYGTWEIFDNSKVKFTLTQTAVDGNSLYDGKFVTTASLKNVGGNGTTGESVVENIRLKWRVVRAGDGVSVGIVPSPNMTKGVWKDGVSVVGTYFFRANQTDYYNWFKGLLNQGATGSWTSKNNVVIVDALPNGLEFDSYGALEIDLRAPFTDHTGTIVQDLQGPITVDFMNRPGVVKIQQPGQTYDEFYAAVTSAPAPSMGVYNKKIVIINLGNLPSTETFLEMYNRLYSTNFTTMLSFLTSKIGATKAAEWIANAGSVYTDDMKVMDFFISFNAKVSWLDADMDNTEKIVKNIGKMTYDGAGEVQSVLETIYYRTEASILVNNGELYLVKTDSVTGNAIAGVKFDIYEYTGTALNITDVRADTNASNWTNLTSGSPLVTDVDGVIRYQGDISKFYKVVEIATVGNYAITSFELFTRDGTKLEGGIFEMPVDAGIKLLAKNSERGIPALATDASDSETLDNISYADGSVTIIDEVTYTNLVIGTEYVVKGKLVDKVSGDPIEINGNPVTAEQNFIPTAENGTVELYFSFDGSSLKGKTIVVYEKLFENDYEIAKHEDLSDEKQTVYFPDVATSAKDKADDDQIVSATKDVTIVDTVEYYNLIPGYEYVVKGVLMDKKSGKELLSLDGSPITAQQKFTPQTANGTVELEFTFDASNFAGKTIVVFETLYLDDEVVGSHADLDDIAQTIVVSKKDNPPVETGYRFEVLPWSILTVVGLTVAMGTIILKKRKNSVIE